MPEEKGARQVSVEETSMEELQEQQRNLNREEQEPDGSSPRLEPSPGESGLGKEHTDRERLLEDPVSEDAQALDRREQESGGDGQMTNNLSTMDKEERRRTASAKRVNEETLGSAKERYLARKRAKLSTPVISSDE